MSNLLRAPYETDCYDYRPQFVSDEHCVQECVMAKTVEELNQVPFSVLITNSSINLTLISIIDIRNPPPRETTDQDREQVCQKGMLTQTV